jgi:hypothetical protein
MPFDRSLVVEAEQRRFPSTLFYYSTTSQCPWAVIETIYVRLEDNGSLSSPWPHGQFMTLRRLLQPDLSLPTLHFKYTNIREDKSSEYLHHTLSIVYQELTREWRQSAWYCQ